MDPVSLLDWFSAVACDAATFGREDAAFIAREICERARESGGLRLTLGDIALADDGSVVLTGKPEACDERSSARSIRRILDELLQRAPDSTPALRLCAARFEDTTLELLAKDLEFAGGTLDRAARRASIAAAVATIRVTMKDGVFAGPPPTSFRASPVPEPSLPPISRALPTSTLLAMAPPLSTPTALPDPTVERMRAQLAASELERTRLASSLTMYGDALREAQGRIGLASAEIDASRAEAEALRRAAKDVEERLLREIEAREAQRAAQLESEQGRRATNEAQARALEDEARRRREAEARLAAVERSLAEAAARSADAEARSAEAKAERESASMRAQASLAEVEALRTSLAAQTEQARELRDKAARLEREVTRQAERAGATRTLPIEEHEQALAAATRDKAAALAALEREKAELVAALAREKDSALAALARAREELQLLAASEAQHRATIAAREDALAEQTRKLQELERSAMDERRKVETATADLETRAARLRTIEARLEAQEAEATQRLQRTEQAAAARVTELEAETARLLEQEVARAERALEAERKEAQRRENETAARHKAELARVIGSAEAGSAENVATLEAAHQRALDQQRKEHGAALAEAAQLANQQKAALEKTLAELRGRLDRAELTARSELLRARDGWNAEAETRHTRELGAALQKLRVTLEEESERTRAEERYNHTSALTALRAEHDALLASLRKERDQLEQSLFRALADRDAERQLRIDVESKASHSSRELRRRSLAASEPIEPKVEAAAAPSKEEPNEPKTETPEPPEASVPPTPLPDRVRRVLTGNRAKLASLGGYGALGLLGGLAVFATVRAVSPLFLAPEAPLPPPPKAAGSPAGSAVAMNPPSSCQASLELENVVKGSEVLRRVGQAPVSFVVPMRVPLELVVTHEGYVPKRLSVSADTEWAVDGPSPHLSLEAVMEGNAVASTGTTGFEKFPRTDRHSPPPTDGARGLLTVRATPAGADLWLTVDPKTLRDLPCGAPVEILVVAPLGTVRKERVEWSAFHGAPPAAKLKL
ncbi:MAG: hypothetical protein JNL79_35340 [Myxococcales bacterium]|nr:hypothetical protein [Myxococcales bacterium]